MNLSLLTFRWLALAVSVPHLRAIVMNFKTRVPRARGVNVLLLLINVVIILSIQGSAEAAVHEESGELIQTELQETGQELHNGEDASPARTPASDPKAASLERFAVEDGPYLTKQVREPQLQGDKKPRGSRVLLLNRIVSMGLLASIVVLAGLVFWEVYNYVGDTSDPLKNAGDASWVPAMIEDMLRQGKSLAFVVKLAFLAFQTHLRRAFSTQPHILLRVAGSNESHSSI